MYLHVFKIFKCGKEQREKGDVILIEGEHRWRLIISSTRGQKLALESGKLNSNEKIESSVFTRRPLCRATGWKKAIKEMKFSRGSRKNGKYGEKEKEREIITFDYCFIFYSVLYYDSKLITPSNYWRREPDKEK